MKNSLENVPYASSSPKASILKMHWCNAERSSLYYIWEAARSVCRVLQSVVFVHFANQILDFQPVKPICWLLNNLVSFQTYYGQSVAASTGHRLSVRRLTCTLILHFNATLLGKHSLSLGVCSTLRIIQGGFIFGTIDLCRVVFFHCSPLQYPHTSHRRCYRWRSITLIRSRVSKVEAALCFWDVARVFWFWKWTFFICNAMALLL